MRIPLATAGCAPPWCCPRVLRRTLRRTLADAQLRPSPTILRQKSWHLCCSCSQSVEMGSRRAMCVFLCWIYNDDSTSICFTLQHVSYFIWLYFLWLLHFIFPSQMFFGSHFLASLPTSVSLRNNYLCHFLLVSLLASLQKRFLRPIFAALLLASL